MSTASKHTPGPWKYVIEEPYAPRLLDANGIKVPGITLWQDDALSPDDQEYNSICESNGKFIANAPLTASKLEKAEALNAELVNALKQINHSMKQARIYGNDYRRELELSENISSAALAHSEKGGLNES